MCWYPVEGVGRSQDKFMRLPLCVDDWPLDVRATVRYGPVGSAFCLRGASGSG